MNYMGKEGLRMSKNKIIRKPRPRHAYNLRSNEVAIKKNTMLKACAEYLDSIIDLTKASYFLLSELSTMPGILIVSNGNCYFLEIIHGKKPLSLKKEKNFADLEKSGAKIVICRSTEAMILTLKHWNIPLYFNWKV